MNPCIWKYIPNLIPDSDKIISLNEGATPLRLSKIGRKVGIIKNLRIKDETWNPTGTFLDRGKFALEGLSESISYELKTFGIRIVIIEPVVIRTNIMNSSVLAKKALDPKSPYSPLMQKVENGFKSMLENASISSPPEEVAKVILQAVTSENPQLRYEGNDAANILQAKRTMSDADFADFIKQQFHLF